MKTAYLNHPLSAKRKAEYRGKGFRIIDAKFAPEEKEKGDFVDPAPKAEAD